MIETPASVVWSQFIVLCISITQAAAARTITSLKNSEALLTVTQFMSDVRDDLPLEQALLDLETYLDNRSFKKCQFERTTNDHLVKTTYFLDITDKIHLRMDNRTLLISGQ